MTATRAERMVTARRALERAEAAAGLRTRLAAPLVADDDGGSAFMDDDGRGPVADRSVHDDGGRARVVTTGNRPGRGADTCTPADTRVPAVSDAPATPTSPAGTAAHGASATRANPAAPAGTGPLAVEGTDHLPVPPALADFFSAAGLRRGSVVQVGGSSSLLLALLATAQGEGWTALAALPDIGLQAAAEAGLALERSLLVPRPGPEAGAVLGALVDGVDVLAVGDCRALNGRDRRLLSARLRSRGAVLLSTAHWPGADVVLRAGETRAGGLGKGWGRVETGELTVHGRSRSGAAGRVRVRVRLGSDGLSALHDELRGDGLRDSTASDDGLSILHGVRAGDAPTPASAEQPARTTLEPARSPLQAVS